MPQDEPDLNDFSTSPDNRLPPISGAQALQNEIQRARAITTGLPGLDFCLNPHNSPITNNGLRRGYVTEIYGPPGSGKTAFGIQVAVNAIHTLGKAVWISSGSPLIQSRLNDINAAHKSQTACELPSSPPGTSVQQNQPPADFIYKEIQSLPHLLVMLMHPTVLFPPPNTAAIIVDGLPNILASAFPRQLRGKHNLTSVLKENAAKSAAGKRHQMIENLAGALSRLAMSRHTAVVVLNKTTTSMKGGQRALLKPSIGGQAWDAAVNTRIVLYRDLYPRHIHTRLTIREKRGYRLAEVVRLGAKDVAREPVPFVIETSGLRELALFDDGSKPSAPFIGAKSLDNAPLQIRPSQPETRTTVPLITQDTFPTASQMLRKGTAQLSQDTPIPVPLNLPTVTFTSDDDEPASPQPRPTKRKAVEIADSEDEDEDEEPGLIATNPNDAVTTTLNATPHPPFPIPAPEHPNQPSEDVNWGATDLQEAASELVEQALDNGEELGYEEAEDRAWQARHAIMQRYEAVEKEAHLLVDQYVEESETLSRRESMSQIIEFQRTGVE